MRKEGDDRIWCHQERLAVRLRGPQRLHGDPRRCARFVLDDNRLAETALQLLAHKARSDIDGTAGWKSDQDLDRPGRPGRLGLRGNGLGNEHVFELLEAPCLGRLTELGLTGNRFDEEAVRALANCPRLANLKKLRVMYNERLRAEAFLALASSPYLDNLEHLEWTGWVDEAGAQALLDSPHFRNLRYVYGVPYENLPGPLRERMRGSASADGAGRLRERNRSAGCRKDALVGAPGEMVSLQERATRTG